MKRNKSQIAVIITFVIVILILLVVVFINIAKVGQIKTSTSQATDRAALSLASQIGSMAHYYKVVALNDQGTEETIDGKKVLTYCEWNWKTIIMFVIAILTFIAYFVWPPALLIGAALGFLVNSMMLGGIAAKYREMTSYNAIREATLFQALAAVQTDDVQLKATSKGSGAFCEDANGDGTCERVYDLAALGLTEMQDQVKVDRFSAWYYWNRLRYAWEKDNKTAGEINLFVYGAGDYTYRNGLMKFISVDTTKPWGDIETLSYMLIPGTGTSSAYNCMKDSPCNMVVPDGTQVYDVTCGSATSPCPGWVMDPATDKIWITRLNTNVPSPGGTEDIYDGFLKDKFISLLNRLEVDFPGTFCSTCPINPEDVDNLIADTGFLLRRIRETVNMAMVQRVNNVTQWMRDYYNFESHKPNRTSSRDPFANSPCADFCTDRVQFNEHYKDDVYLRLWRDRIYIQRWIIRLEEILTIIKTDAATAISTANGHDAYGLGGAKDQCPMTYCCSHDCEITCCDPADCTFEGIYCSSCYGDGKPPVCVNGDLYDTKPAWCPLPNRNANCACSCTYSPACLPSCNYQGPYSSAGSTEDPTEIDQVLAILRALQFDFHRLQMMISRLSDEVRRVLDSLPIPADSGDLKRNEIVYAWKDKKEFSHLVRVKLDGYPTAFPYITESIEWYGFKLCRTLHEYTGNFSFTVSRYDQDQPSNLTGWKLRRRKQVNAAEFPVGTLSSVVDDIQDDAILNSQQGAVDQILSQYAIESMANATYGPEKEDIYIVKTEGD